MSIAAAGLGLIRALPTELAVAAARSLLLLYLLFSSRTRTEIRRNCRLVLDNGYAGQGFWLRMGWRLGRNLALMAHGSHRVGLKLLDNAEIRGENILERILLGGNRIVVLSMHYGLWEYLPWLFGRLGHDVCVGQGLTHDAALADMIRQVRLRHQVTMTDSLTEMRRALRSRRVVGFVLDNTSRTRRLGCATLGRGLALLRTPFALARMERAVLVPILASEDAGRLRVQVHEPVQDVEEFGRLARRPIRERPEDWVFWNKT